MHAIAVAIDIALTGIVALVLIVVNERFKDGVPDSLLAVQSALFLTGATLLTNNVEFFGHAILRASAFAGIIGFITLIRMPGPWRFNKNRVFPGMKG